MSNECGFQVGDAVEVLPCKEGGSFHELAHCQVAGRRGTVLIVKDGGRSVGVHFPGLCGNNLFGNITATTGWWCEPAWLRRVPKRVRCASCGQEVPGTQAVDHNTLSRPQDARSAPSKGGGGSPAQPWVGTIGWNVPWKMDVTFSPRYMVGDLVDMGDHKGLKVVDIDAEPRYSVQWPDGHVQRIKESTLRPHVAAPVKCAPDGTRCEEWQNSGSRHRMEAQEFRLCPFCGGKLKEGS